MKANEASTTIKSTHEIDALLGTQASSFFLGSAAKGYRVVFSFAEPAPGRTGHLVLLAAEHDGKPLADDEGPLHLVLPDDIEPLRRVRQLASLAVRQAAP